jgi:hypothetical protein
MKTYMKMIAILVTSLLISSFVVSANTLNVKEADNNQNENTNFGTLGTGGWHEEDTVTQDGRVAGECQAIYIWDSGEGRYVQAPHGTGWEYASEGRIRFYERTPYVKAYYVVDVGDSCLREGMQVGVKYKDMTGFFITTGIHLQVMDWEKQDYSNSWGSFPDHDSYRWEWETPPSSAYEGYDNQFVNERGEVFICLFFDNIHDIVVEKVGVKFEAADEEIDETDVTYKDNNHDGSNDGIQIEIDADVGRGGDDTTVEVTAVGILFKPNGAEIDEDELTWTIRSHMDESPAARLTLSALGGPNGEYNYWIKLYDECGNVEDILSETVNLYPEGGGTNSELTITKPVDGGLYFSNKLFFSGMIKPVIFRGIEVKVDASENIDKVEFYVNGDLKHTDDSSSSFTWSWNNKDVDFSARLSVKGFDGNNEVASDNIPSIFYFNP